MPFFRYSVQDRAGQTLNGTISAKTQDEASFALHQRGYQVLQLHDVRGAPAIVKPQVQTPVPFAPPSQVRHTISGRDADRFFLFAQMTSALNAGINPAIAFDQVANRVKPYYRESMRELSQAATEGKDLAVVMERWPDLFPEHVVGMTRSGQQGGFLAEAFAHLSEQAHNAHRFKRWFFWVWFVALNAIISIPGMIWAMNSLVRAWEIIDASGGDGGFEIALRQVAQGFLQVLAWPVGPLFLLFSAILYILYRYLGSRFAKRFRHRLGLKWPVYGPRARHENLTTFTWTMSKLARAGIPPARAWQLAADAAPNLAMRDALREVAGRLSGAERMSDIVHGTKLFPDEYAAMIATAEYTGDLSSALEHLAATSKGEMQAAENYAKVRSGCWGALGCFMTSAAMLGIFWYMYYYVLMPKIVGAFGEP